MTPQKTITLADDVFEQIQERARAEGKTVEETANEAVRLGLSEGRWQRLLRRGRDYGHAAMGEVSEDDAERIAVDAVRELRADKHR